MLAYKWFPDTFDDAQGWVNRFRFLFRLLGKCGVSVGAIPGAQAKQVCVCVCVCVCVWFFFLGGGGEVEEDKVTWNSYDGRESTASLLVSRKAVVGMQPPADPCGVTGHWDDGLEHA